jgi:maleate cis-trans isomerase
MATSRLVLEALQTLGMKKVVLLTPYKSNKNVIDYLNASDIGVVRDVAMGLEPGYFGRVSPQQWTELAKKQDGPDSDGALGNDNSSLHNLIAGDHLRIASIDCRYEHTL